MSNLGVGAIIFSVLVGGGCAFDQNGVSSVDLDASVGDDDGPVSEPIDASPVDARNDAGTAPDPIDAAVPDATVPDAAPLAPDAGVPQTCPSGYTQGSGQSLSCYKLVLISRRWSEAEGDCANDASGTHLVVVDSEAEYSAIQNNTTGQLWIGASDRKLEGSFRQVTGAAFVSTHFAPGEPNDGGGGGGGPGGNDEDCLELRDDGLNDEQCDSSHPYLCERDGVAPDTSAF